MKRTLCFRPGWVLVALLLAASGCQTVSEDELAQQVRESQTAAEKIIVAKQYLGEFPDGAQRDEVARALFRAAVETGDADAVSMAAPVLLKGRSGARLNAMRNFVAWTLAEKGLALDLAERYGRTMVEEARKETSDELPSYLDTLAYVLYRQGNAEEAVELQEEAVTAETKDPGMIARLALYQHAVGEHLEALQTAASAILMGDQGEILAQFPTWLNDDGDAEETARQIIEPAVSDYLLAHDTPIAQGRAALLLALGNIDLGRAEDLVEDALKELQAQDSPYDRRDIEVDRAQVLCARGDYAGAVDLLEPQKPHRNPWDGLYWYTIGRAYRLSGRPDQATSALLEPLLIEETPLVMTDLHELGLSDAAIETRVEAKREALENFDPGTYDGKIPAEGRTVLLELFTGAECNPCQSADLAVDLLSEYFPRKAVAILEYHVHIPGADPLTTPDSEARYRYYGGGGTPTVKFNGTEDRSGGGPRILKKSLFETYRTTVEQLWTQPSEVSLEASAQRQQDEVNVMVRVTPSTRSETVTPQGVIRIALVETSVEYTGGNGIDHQAFVVRDLNRVDEPGTTLADGSAFLNHTFHLDALEKNLRTYLDEFEQDPPERYKGFGGFRAKPVSLDREHLAVVVWVENRETKAVLQAAYIGL